MKTIKLIATDIDGTLLSSDRSISQENFNYIKELDHEGRFVTLVTSRHLKGLPVNVLETNAIRYTITSNGAAIYDHQHEKYIEKVLMDKDRILPLLRQLQDFKAVITVAMFGDIITDNDSLKNIVAKSEEEREEVIRFFNRSRKLLDVESLVNKIKESEGIEKIHLNFGTVSDKDDVIKFLNTLPDFDDYHITSSYYKNVEISHKNATKLEAVLRLANKIQIANQQILTIGDGENDIEMFKASENSIAMLNASDYVKEHALFVTDYNNDENGWSRYIKKYIANRE